MSTVTRERMKYPKALEKRAPRPWTVDENTLFEAQVLSATHEGGELTVVMQGGRDLCTFIAELVNGLEKDDA